MQRHETAGERRGRSFVVSIEDGEAAELAVHALAQLPDRVTLEIRGPMDARMRLIAEAYGISDRITVVSRSDSVASRGKPQSLAGLVESLALPDDPPASLRDSGTLLTDHYIAIVTNVPTHYRVPLFNQLARRLQSAGAVLRVFFLANVPSSRQWMEPGLFQFHHEFLHGVDLSSDPGRRVVPLDFERRLKSFAPTLILCAGFSPAVAMRAALYAQRTDVPFGIWSGELASRATAQRPLREIQRRWLARRASFAISYGSESAEYLRRLNPDLPIVLGRNSTIAPLMQPRRTTSEPIQILTVARAVPGKAIDTVIAALDQVRHLRCRLTMIGDGPEMPALRALAAGDGRVHFAGAVSSTEIRRFFAESDVFVFPSEYDVFGIVLVEAMAAGLPSIVSSRPGAVSDLCVSNVNSLVVPAGDVAAWASSISRVVGDQHLRRRLGAAASRTIRSRWTIEHAADAMLAGFRLGVLATARTSSS